MTNHEKVLELRSQITKLNKEADNIEDMLGECYKEMEQLQGDFEPVETEDEITLTFNKNELHKLLSILENSLISSDMNHSDRTKLIKYSEEITWKVADEFGYDLYAGTVSASDLTFKEFNPEDYDLED